MIDESQFQMMLAKELKYDVVFVHECFMSLFSGMLNWVADVLYPRFNYKVITTYDKAVEVFTKKLENKDGQVQSNFLPALTLDPNLDFSNEERAGRFFWMFKNLDNVKGIQPWKRILLTDQGVAITPMFTRYQGTVELTAWMTSMYDLIDFRAKLIQFCGGFQRWIRPENFWTNLILPKEIIQSKGPKGDIDWSGINPSIVTLETTNTKEYALPFQLDAIWRLDSFADATNKMGSDQIAEYKCSPSFTWECNIPTFIRVENYVYPIETINLNVGMTPAQAKYPLHTGYSLYTNLDLYREIVLFSKTMPIWNISNENANVLIKVPDGGCDCYPFVYQNYNHYVCGKILYIENLTDPSQITDSNSILVISEYRDEYLPYIRKCKGLVSHFDKLSSYKLMEIVQNYHISYMCNIQDSKLFRSIVSLHGKEVTFDVLGRYIYDGIQHIHKYTSEDDFSKFVFNHNIVRMIKDFNLKDNIKNEYKLPFGEVNLNSKISVLKPQIVYSETLKPNQHIIILPFIVNKNAVDKFSVKINEQDIIQYKIHNNIIEISEDIEINENDKFDLYKTTDVVETQIELICEHLMTKQEESDYYSKKSYLKIDISNSRCIDLNTLYCVSYSGFMTRDVDYVIDEKSKIITFRLEPQRDCYIQIYGRV